MKTRNITLLTVFAAAAALAPTAQADLTTGMSSVLRSESGGAFSTDGMGTSIGNGDYALGNFDILDTDAHFATGSGASGGVPYFGHENDKANERGWVASSVLTGAGGGLLAGAQYVATQDTDKNTLAQYQITFDRPGTFYILSDSRGTFVTTGYSDTGVDISYTQHGAAFNVWAQEVSAGQTVTTPVITGGITNGGFAFQPAGGTPPAASTAAITSITWGSPNASITMTGVDSTDYTCESSIDLVDWALDASAPNPINTTSSSATFDVAAGAVKKFYRIAE